MMASGNTRTHRFHGQAEVLTAQLQLPLKQEIKPQAYAKLPNEGGYRSEQAQNYRFEGVLSFQTAYTQVAGNRSLKEGQGWTTLVTSVITGVNVLDVVTADRVVAQIATVHPLVGYIPTVNFLGTRFENLRIAGHEVQPAMDLGICGQKPDNDEPYIHDPEFLGRVSQQYARINGSQGGPEWIGTKYSAALLDPARIKSQNAAVKAAAGKGQNANKPKVECSLVNRVAENLPGTPFGHVIDVPGFGTVSLANLTVDDDSFQLTMIRLDLGCPAHGTSNMGTCMVNGKTVP